MKTKTCQNGRSQHPFRRRSGISRRWFIGAGIACSALSLLPSRPRASQVGLFEEGRPGPRALGPGSLLFPDRRSAYLAAKGAIEIAPFPESMYPGDLPVSTRDAHAAAYLDRALDGLGYRGGSDKAFAPGLAAVPPKDNLRERLRRFQLDYGLVADGLYGPETRSALLRPKGTLLSKLSQALSLPEPDAAERMILVNVAARTVRYFEGRRELFSARSIVGIPSRQTVSFSSEMVSITFNPPWYVPPGILRKDVLPKMREDPEYALRNSFTVYDVSAGDYRVIDPLGVDWSEEGVDQYLFVQRGGGRSALGRVKFEMPNEHIIFLHDTPDQHLYDRPSRLASSGCVRVEGILDLAREILGEHRWADEGVSERLEKGETFRLGVGAAFPVLFEYRLADADPEGRVMFYPDVYKAL